MKKFISYTIFFISWSSCAAMDFFEGNTSNIGRYQYYHEQKDKRKRQKKNATERINLSQEEYNNYDDEIYNLSDEESGGEYPQQSHTQLRHNRQGLMTQPISRWLLVTSKKNVFPLISDKLKPVPVYHPTVNARELEKKTPTRNYIGSTAAKKNKNTRKNMTSLLIKLRQILEKDPICALFMPLLIPDLFSELCEDVQNIINTVKAENLLISDEERKLFEDFEVKFTNK